MIELLKSFELECEVATGAYIDQNPNEYGEPWKNFQSLFGHLYLFSCCHWGCHGKHHVFEHLGGRIVTNASVAVRSIFHGYYDEGLALVRSIGEIANLVNLFMSRPSKLREWLDADETSRWQRFGPAEVRKMLEGDGVLVPFDKKHYGFLCESVHPAPHRAPNTYSDHGQPVLGLDFQERGFRLSFWNLLWATSVVCGPIARLAILDQPRAEEFVDLTIPVFEAAWPQVAGQSELS